MTADQIRLIVRAYRAMAYVTGTALIVLCFVGIPLQVFAHQLGVVKVDGAIHGVLYIIYVMVAFVMTRAVRMRVASVGTVVVLLAGIIPVGTFVIERWATHRYIEPALAGYGRGPAAAAAAVGG